MKRQIKPRENGDQSPVRQAEAKFISRYRMLLRVCVQVPTFSDSITMISYHQWPGNLRLATLKDVYSDHLKSINHV